MEQKFKTNLKCGGCLATVKPHLDKVSDITYSVDLADANKVLSIQAQNPAQIQQAVQAVVEAGFKIEPL
jgi:copper chaperone CopZ